MQATEEYKRKQPANERSYADQNRKEDKRSTSRDAGTRMRTEITRNFCDGESLLPVQSAISKLPSLAMDISAGNPKVTLWTGKP
jgi:hypothetical protein